MSRRGEGYKMNFQNEPYFDSNPLKYDFRNPRIREIHSMLKHCIPEDRLPKRTGRTLSEFIERAMMELRCYYIDPSQLDAQIMSFILDMVVDYVYRFRLSEQTKDRLRHYRNSIPYYTQIIECLELPTHTLMQKRSLDPTWMHDYLNEKENPQIGRILL
jgi:hypothetical protein